MSLTTEDKKWIESEIIGMMKWANDRLDELEGRLGKRFDAVEAGLAEVREDLAGLREELVGVVDPDFPVVGRQHEPGGPRAAQRKRSAQ